MNRKQIIYYIVVILFLKQQSINCLLENSIESSKAANPTINRPSKRIYNIRECVLICAKCFQSDLDFFGKEVIFFLNLIFLFN